MEVLPRASNDMAKYSLEVEILLLLYLSLLFVPVASGSRRGLLAVSGAALLRCSCMLAIANSATGGSLDFVDFLSFVDGLPVFVHRRTRPFHLGYMAT